MATLRMPLVLASASPRRREILARLGIPCDVRPSGVGEEARPDEAPEALVRRLASEKAAEVASRGPGVPPGAVVLGADTVVVVQGKVLGKPADDVDAAAMLRRLSGQWHQVITGVSLHRAAGPLLESIACVTEVRFRGMSADTIARYVATGEGRDKAGAYAVQGVGAGLVSEVRGSYDNVVGLPSADVLALLERHGVLEGWP
jgi:septum formation protein